MTREIQYERDIDKSIKSGEDVDRSIGRHHQKLIKKAHKDIAGLHHKARHNPINVALSRLGKLDKLPKNKLK